MPFTIDRRGSSAVAVFDGGEIAIATVQDALDLVAAASFESGCSSVLIAKEAVSDSFFDLKNGLAGEVLQKFVNYNVRVALVGDFSMFTGPLRDFIRESNKGGRIFFLPDNAQALDALHGSQ